MANDRHESSDRSKLPRSLSQVDARDLAFIGFLTLGWQHLLG
jgi:hypothetical protein